MKFEEIENQREGTKLYRSGVIPKTSFLTRQEKPAGWEIVLQYFTEGARVNVVDYSTDPHETVRFAIEDIPTVIAALATVLDIDQRHRSEQGE